MSDELVVLVFTPLEVVDFELLVSPKVSIPRKTARNPAANCRIFDMESSDEDEDFSYHEGIIPQSKINSLYQSNTEKVFSLLQLSFILLSDSTAL